jgi:hypothetical protein
VASTEDNTALNKLPHVRFEFIVEFPIRAAFPLISSVSISFPDRFIPGPDQLKGQKYLHTVVRGGAVD